SATIAAMAIALIIVLQLEGSTNPIPSHPVASRADSSPDGRGVPDPGRLGGAPPAAPDPLEPSDSSDPRGSSAQSIGGVPTSSPDPAATPASPPAPPAA